MANDKRFVKDNLQVRTEFAAEIAPDGSDFKRSAPHGVRNSAHFAAQNLANGGGKKKAGGKKKR